MLVQIQEQNTFQSQEKQPGCSASRSCRRLEVACLGAHGNFHVSPALLMRSGACRGLMQRVLWLLPRGRPASVSPRGRQEGSLLSLSESRRNGALALLRNPGLWWGQSPEESEASVLLCRSAHETVSTRLSLARLNWQKRRLAQLRKHEDLSSHPQHPIKPGAGVTSTGRLRMEGAPGWACQPASELWVH